MKRIAALAGVTLLGTVVAVSLYFVLVLAVLEPMLTAQSADMDVEFLIVMPLALFIGSLLTGFLGQPHVRTAYVTTFIAPGLYLSSLLIVMTCVEISAQSAGLALSAFIAGSLWFMVSWSGIGLGFFVRAKRQGSLS